MPLHWLSWHESIWPRVRRLPRLVHGTGPLLERVTRESGLREFIAGAMGVCAVDTALRSFPAHPQAFSQPITALPMNQEEYAMELAQQIIELIKFLVEAALVSGGVLVVLLIVVSLLPKDNVLQRLLVAFTKRLALMLGLTLGAGMFEWLPGPDVLLDIAAAVISGWYWIKLFWEARDILADSRAERSRQERLRARQAAVIEEQRLREETLLLSARTPQADEKERVP